MKAVVFDVTALGTSGAVSPKPPEPGGILCSAKSTAKVPGCQSS